MLRSIIEIGIAATEFIVLATAGGALLLRFRMLKTTTCDRFCDRGEGAFGFGNRLGCDGIRGGDGSGRKL